jgi:hypothetical protein
MLFLWKMSKCLQTPLATMTHSAEGLCFKALLMLKVENSLICLVGTHTNSVQDGKKIYFALENIYKK